MDPLPLKRNGYEASLASGPPSPHGAAHCPPPTPPPRSYNVGGEKSKGALSGRRASEEMKVAGGCHSEENNFCTYRWSSDGRGRGGGGSGWGLGAFVWLAQSRVGGGICQIILWVEGEGGSPLPPPLPSPHTSNLAKQSRTASASIDT